MSRSDLEHIWQWANRTLVSREPARLGMGTVFPFVRGPRRARMLVRYSVRTPRPRRWRTARLSALETHRQAFGDQDDPDVPPGHGKHPAAAAVIAALRSFGSRPAEQGTRRK